MYTGEILKEKNKFRAEYILRLEMAASTNKIV